MPRYNDPGTDNYLAPAPAGNAPKGSAGVKRAEQDTTIREQGIRSVESDNRLHGPTRSGQRGSAD